MPPSSSAPASKHKHGAHVLASLAVINLEVVVVVVVVVVPIPANLKVNSATQSVITIFLRVMRMPKPACRLLRLTCSTNPRGIDVHQEHHKAMAGLSSRVCL